MMQISTETARRSTMTRKETVRLLCKSLVTRLENQKAITFPHRLRSVIQDEVFGLIGPFILTEEDLKERVLAKLNANAESLKNSEFTESDQYKAAKIVILRSFGDNEWNGLYFQKPIKVIADTVVSYLMRSSNIEDVFETDEDIERLLLDWIKKFDEASLH